MHVALYRRQQDFAVGFAHTVFFRFDKRNQVRHRFFHDACGFNHLWQEHLTGTKQVSDDVHAIHQWPFNHMKRFVGLLAGFFGVFFDEFGNPVN